MSIITRIHLSTLVLSLIICTVDLSAASIHDYVIHFPDNIPTQKPTQRPEIITVQSQKVNSPRQFVANLTECAMNNETFCTKNDRYPLEHIQHLLLEHANEYAELNFTDMSPDGIADRVADEMDEYLCESYEKVIFPIMGRTQDGHDQYIINIDQFRQGVRVSMCQSAGQPCRYSEHFPIGRKSECEQQQVYRQLLSLSSSGEMIRTHFKFPACCSCVLHIKSP